MIVTSRSRLTPSVTGAVAALLVFLALLTFSSLQAAHNSTLLGREAVNNSRQLSQLKALALNNKESLQILRDATSPKAQAKNADIVQALDCSSQQTIQRAVDVIRGPGINVMSATCVAYAKTHP